MLKNFKINGSLFTQQHWSNAFSRCSITSCIAGGELAMADNDYDYDEDDIANDDNDATEAPEVDVDPEVAARKRNEVSEAESLSPSAKESLRRELEAEMERFLASGGRINEVPPEADSGAHG